VRLTLVFPAICDDSSLDLSFLPSDLEDIGVSDYEANLNYCPVIGLDSLVVLGTGLAGQSWDAQADLTDFFAEINFHPDYVGGFNIVDHKFVDSDGVQVGNNTLIGLALFCDNIDKNLSEVFYQMSVFADFNTGGGVHTVNYTLTVTIPQPTGSDDYSTNAYICNDLGNIPN
jgi:hypothetical protein